MTKKSVLISYSHSDAEWAREFARALESRGVEVWIDQFNVQAVLADDAA